MKVETNKEIFFEKTNKIELNHCTEDETFLEVLKKEIEPINNDGLSIYADKKKNNDNYDNYDIYDTLIYV